MRLARYRSRPLLRIPGRIAALFGTIWLALIGWGFWQAGELPSEDEEAIYLTYVDRELRVLAAGADESRFVRWLTGADDEHETLVELREVLEELREQTALHTYASACLAVLHAETGQEEVARAVLAACAGDERTPSFLILESYLRGEGPDPAEIEILEAEIVTGANYAWDARIYRLCIPSSVEVLEWVFENSDEYDEVALQRSLTSFAFWAVLIAVGFVLSVPSVRHLRGRTFRGYQRVMGSWSPVTVVGLFCASSLLSDLGALRLTALLALAPWEAPQAAYYLIDLCMRVIPVVVMGLFLFRRPDHFVRVFAPTRVALGSVVVTALALIAAVDWVLYLATGSWVEVDPTDFLWWSDPSGIDLAYLYLAGAVVAPITEEVLCRGFLFLGLKERLGGWPALLLSSTIFALVHTQYEFPGLLSVWIFGAVSAALAWRTQSILPSILLHALLNLLLISLTHYEFYLPL